MTRTLLQPEHQAAVLHVLPDYALSVQRLAVLAQNEAAPVITVIGKYNHGKSSLLNELVGESVFAVADKRETVCLQRVEQTGVTWLDAPGLDADVHQDDDRHAELALWVESDIRLVVHAVKEGELDASELAVLNELQHDMLSTQRQAIVVLSQTDQLEDDQTLEQIQASIQQQLPAVQTYPVSVVRYRKGVDSCIPLFVEKSGFPDLQAQLKQAIQHVPAARAHEQAQRIKQLQTALQTKKEQVYAQQVALQQQAQQAQQGFSHDLQRALEQIAVDLHEVMQEPERDHALDPDTIHDVFTMTAGKRERSQLQIAYSRACILIRSVLTQYGVVHLPKAQQVASASLSTVMVAVMGISVKYRADLRRLFGETAGRERLHRDFSAYFERSEARLALLERITQLQADLVQIQTALEVVQTWECTHEYSL